MRKLLLTLGVALSCLVASAVPAIPTPQKVTQPDGTELTVRIKGDEFYGYITTLDGYTIIKNDNGYYTYATLVNDEVVPTKIIARDAERRSKADAMWLERVGKNLKSKAKVENGKTLRAQRDAMPGLKLINYSNFHGIVILVNFLDSKFTRSDVQEFYNRMINEENYTGYTNEDGSANPYGQFTGSVRDYFYDNSNGVFAPQFDVVGPIDVNYNVNQGNAQASAILRSAVVKADSQVDFSQYDLNNDGRIDLVYFIVADSPSSSDPSSPNHLWPHRSQFYPRVKYDGKYLVDYACSAEYIYAKSNGIFDGIGTICHEFSHVLGLPDLYDTNEDNNGTYGEAQHPGEWDLMAGGNYQNNARTPVAYSFYDRYSTGFANYQVITAEGEYELNPIGETGEGYILKSPVNKEVFLIENRQKTSKWDAYAPGHGMMVARMDSTSTSVWEDNAPNGSATRLYYELLRAGGSTDFQNASDAFPGTIGAPIITNNTMANFLTYNKKPNGFNFCDIREENGVIKFSVVQDGSLLNEVEDFEVMPASTSKNTTNAQGTLATWTLMNCHAENVTDGHGTGNIAVAMKKSSTLTMTSDINNNAYIISFDIYNPTNNDSKFKVYQSVNQGGSWSALKNLNKTEVVTVPKGGKTTVFYPITAEGPARFRLSYSTGSSADQIYVDDVKFYYKEKEAAIPGDVNGDGEVTGSDVTALYNHILFGQDTEIFNGDQNGDGEVTGSDVTAVYNIILGL